MRETLKFICLLPQNETLKNMYFTELNLKSVSFVCASSGKMDNKREFEKQVRKLTYSVICSSSDCREANVKTLCINPVYFTELPFRPTNASPVSNV